MCRPSFRLLIPFIAAMALIPFSPNSSAYDDQVYNNLLKSRDALSTQQSDLQSAYDETRKQIDALNAKLTRIDMYLRQVDTSLRDVDTALTYAKK